MPVNRLVCHPGPGDMLTWGVLCCEPRELMNPRSAASMALSSRVKTKRDLSKTCEGRQS